MKILKHVAILMLLAVYFSSCSNKVPEEPGGHENLIGKWKMEKVDLAWNQGILDLPQYNILYEFSPDGILTITGVTDDIGDFKSGEYLYSILTEEEMAERFGGFYFSFENAMYLEIKNIEYYFYFSSSKKMRMTCFSYSDSSTCIFKKITN